MHRQTSNTITVGDVNTPLSPIDRSFRKKSIVTAKINDKIDKMYLTDSHKIFNQTAIEYKFFSRAHRLSPK
jgi:hypothetical protein